MRGLRGPLRKMQAENEALQILVAMRLGDADQEESGVCVSWPRGFVSFVAWAGFVAQLHGNRGLRS